MNNVEAEIMAMMLERERLVREHIEEGSTLRALADRPDRAKPAGRGGVLKRASAVADAVRRGFRRWLALPWDEPSPCGSAATACDV